MAQSEGDEIALEIVVYPYCAITSDYNQFFIFGPAQSLDGAFIPVDAVY